MIRSAAPFRPATLLALLLAGAAAFILLLYALGAGWDGSDDRDGGAHAASNGLIGFAAFAALLEAEGRNVSLSRSPAALEQRSLLVMTPPQFADGEELDRIIQNRRYTGPTLLILPKWFASPVPADPRIEAEEGWVALMDPRSPGWTRDIAGLDDARLAIGQTDGWTGLGRSGDLPEADAAQAVLSEQPGSLRPLMLDAEGDILAAWRDDGGYYPFLARTMQADVDAVFGEDSDSEAWPLVVVIEPDLINNYGMAERGRALAMLALVDAILEDQTMPIVFDLTIPGLGRTSNLLTLAFRPPFLAATFCLLLAAALVAWRALPRFGPVRAEMPALANGKTQLARNGAALIQRTGRTHLLAEPYAALIIKRVASRLALHEARTEDIDQALSAHGGEPGQFLDNIESLREARRPRALLRAAAALATIERKLK